MSMSQYPCIILFRMQNGSIRAFMDDEVTVTVFSDEEEAERCRRNSLLHSLDYQIVELFENMI